MKTEKVMHGYTFTYKEGENATLILNGIPEPGTKYHGQLIEKLFSIPKGGNLSIVVSGIGGDTAILEYLNTITCLNKLVVTTHLVGSAVSTSAGIFLLGDTRIVSDTGFLAIRKISATSINTRKDTGARRVSNSTYSKLSSGLMDKLIKPYFSNDNYIIKRYEEGLDVYLDFETCLKYGICTHVLLDNGELIETSMYKKE